MEWIAVFVHLRALTHRAHQAFNALNKICALNGHVDSVHHFLQPSSPFAFLTEALVRHKWHSIFSLLIFSFLSKADACACIHQSAPPSDCYILTSPTEASNLFVWKLGFLLIISLKPFSAPPIATVLWFLIYYFQTWRHWLQQTPAACCRSWWF